jgi:hypothetical protein
MLALGFSNVISPETRSSEIVSIGDLQAIDHEA